MEEQCDYNMYQVTPAEMLGLACWDPRSRGMVLWKAGGTEITEFRDDVLQASHANMMVSQKTK